MRQVVTKEINSCWCGRDVTNQFEIRSYDYSYRTCANQFTFALCDCGSYVLVNRPVDEELPNIYPQNYLAYSPSQSRLVTTIRALNFRLKIRVVKKVMKHGFITTWLDYGAGAGELALNLRHMGVPRVFVVDAHSSIQSVLKQRELFVLKPEQLEELENVDVVSALQVIEHVPDPFGLLSEFFRLLRPGGIVLLETPSPAGLDFKIGRGGKWGGWHAPRHFYVFSESSLCAMIESVGFQIVSCTNIPSPYIWSETLRALLDGTRGGKFISFVTIRNPLFIVVAVAIEACLRLVRFKTSNQRIIAIKPSL